MLDDPAFAYQQIDGKFGLTRQRIARIGTAPQFLTLGHGDGGVFDNEGHFAIQLFEVDAKRGKRK